MRRGSGVLKWVFIGLTFCSLLACSDDDKPAVTSKNLFSSWTDTEDKTVLDLTGFAFDTPTVMVFTFETGEICNCDATITGAQSAGEATLTNCVYDSGGGGDPGCVALENGGNPYDYAKSARTLTFCSAANDCSTFR